MSYWELLRPFYAIFDPFIKRLSYFTYSHRIINGNLNSSRVAYGSVINPEKSYQNAQPILKERNIKCEIISDKNTIFGGLGWDIDRGHFKVYFRFLDFKTLDPIYRKLQPNMNSNCNSDEAKASSPHQEGSFASFFYDSGIISITYDNNGNVLERKLYCYPKDTMVAELKSKLREDTQQDCKGDEAWETKLNRTGKNVLKLYNKSGYKLDAITFKDRMNYTMYFPFIG
jgi:hypothetical protein